MAVGDGDAEDRRGERPEIFYDKGLALMELDRLDEAKTAFERGIESDDAQVRASSFYELGNLAFDAEDWAGAIAAYKDCLRTDSTHEHAKWNLEVAMERLRKEQEEQKKNQDDQEQDGEPGEDGEDQQDGEQGEDEQEQDGEQGEQDEQDEQEGDDNQDGQGQQGEEEQDEQEQEGQGEQEQEGEEEPDESGQEQQQPQNQDGEQEEQEQQGPGEPQPGEAIDAGDTVTHREHGAGFLNREARVVALDLLANDAADFVGADFHSAVR